MVDASCIFFSRPGERISEIFRRGKRIYEKYGHPDEWTMDYQGNLIGYSPREVLLRPDSDLVLESDMALAWSPSVGAARTEDTIVVDSRGFEVVTAAQDWPQIDIAVKGFVIPRPGILERCRTFQVRGSAQIHARTIVRWSLPLFTLVPNPPSPMLAWRALNSRKPPGPELSALPERSTIGGRCRRAFPFGERNATQMGLSWKLGRVAGINVFVHPTFLLVLFVGARGGASSLVLLLSMFACVLLHEFGHALMARRFGIETEDITLYPIGGVARLRRLPRAPGAELLIAIAGPAVNFAIVLLLLTLFWIGLAASPLGPFAEELLVVNLILGVFNLIPAFPMDGGRIFRALLSGWVGRARATIVAATVGRTLAILFGVYSLFFLTELFPQNLIYVGLAAFIYFAAGAEESHVIAEERRRQFTVDKDQGDGIWTAPPGYHWVNRGDGSWQLAPIVVVTTRDARWDGPTWQ